MLQANFDENGYVFDGVDPSGNLVYSKLDGGKAHRIIFTATQESSTIKEIDLPTHGQIYGITFDGERTSSDEPNTYHYTYENLAV